MQRDILIEFHVASVKVQLYELQVCGSKLSEEMVSNLMREFETARRELGDLLCQLIKSALPSCLRTSRLFRTKYTEDIDYRNLDKCLVAAAYKLISLDPQKAPRDVDLLPAQSSAGTFLDVLGTIQCLVASQIEQALKEAVGLPQMEGGSNVSEPHSLSFDPVSTVSHCSVAEASVHGSSPKREWLSDPSDFTEPTPRKCDLCSTTEIAVKVGSKTYRKSIQLPPTSLLCVSEDLLRGLEELDKAAANFEFDFVRSFSRRFRTPKEANDLQIVTVLFSETLMWGLAVQLFNVQQLADRDPSVMFALPRLVVLVGTRILPDSPIGANRLAVGRRLPSLFAASRVDLAHISRQLYALRLDQLCCLTLWLGPRGLPTFSTTSSTSKHSSPVTRPGFNRSNHLPNSRSCGTIPVTSSPVSQSCKATLQKTDRTWQTNLPGLHRIYKRISAVADRFGSDFPSEMRFVLQTCFELHDTSNQDAALALMEGVELPVESYDHDESPVIDVATEVHVNEELTGKHFSDLAKMFDWSGVISNRNIKDELSSVLRNSPFVNQKANADNSFVADASTCEQTTKVSVNQQPTLELGLDVADWLADIGLPSQCAGNSAYANVRYSQSDRSNEVTSTESVSSGTSGGMLKQYFNNVVFGIPIEGEQNRSDGLWHYLPAWQSDRFPIDSAASETDSESYQNSDSDGDTEHPVVFVVGRQCAACLSQFTIFRRRHHCRRCGHIFCSSCCNYKQVIDGLASAKPVRICVECHEFLEPTFL